MPVKVPSPDDVRKSFTSELQALGRVDNSSVFEDFTKIIRVIMNPNWTDCGEWVQLLSDGGQVRLVRVAISQFIDDHQDGQQQIVSTAICAVVNAIKSAIPSGSEVDFVFDVQPDKDVPFGKNVSCLARGVVRNEPRV